MDLSQIIVTTSGVVLIVAVLLFFFGPRTHAAASADSRPRGRRSSAV